MLFLLYFFCFCFTVNGESRIVFDLSSYHTDNKSSHIFEKFTKLTDTSTVISINNKPTSTFCIIQIHTFMINVTLSNTRELQLDSHINGSNIGLILTNETEFFLYTPYANITSLIVLLIYNETSPIPGGCNLSFDTPIAPYQRCHYTDDVIIVESQAASAPPFTACEKNNIQIDLYHMYLNENRRDEESHFVGIKQMITVDSIRANGRKVNKIDGYFTYRKLYSSYRGLGHVFAIIATYNGSSSAYIPTISYGCDIHNYSIDCVAPITYHWKFMLPLLLIFGLFICFFGHKFFKFTTFLNAILFGIFITIILIETSLILDISFADKTTISIVIGVIYATIWLLLWWLCGIPLLSTSIAFFLHGYLISSIIFYAGIADARMFTSNVNYWLVKFSIIILIMIPSFAITQIGHITACSIIGSYAFITAMNYYTGGNLQYIIINSYRRIVVKDFNMATTDPPFQLLDLAQTILWAIMTAYGWYYQLKVQRGRAPFPPHRDYNATTERTPLLEGERRSYPNLRIITFLLNGMHRFRN